MKYELYLYMITAELFTALAAEALKYNNADNMTENEILEQYKKELSKITGKKSRDRELPPNNRKQDIKPHNKTYTTGDDNNPPPVTEPRVGDPNPHHKPQQRQEHKTHP